MKSKRKTKSWTQSYVGHEIGVAKSTVSDIETGRRKPSFDVLIKLLILFDNTELANAILEFLGTT